MSQLALRHSRLLSENGQQGSASLVLIGLGGGDLFLFRDHADRAIAVLHELKRRHLIACRLPGALSQRLVPRGGEVPVHLRLVGILKSQCPGACMLDI